MGGDGAVVDDATAHRLLALHQPERLAQAQERSGEVDVDHRAPLRDLEVLERDAGRVLHRREQRGHRVRVGDVGRHAQPRARIRVRHRGRLLERGLAAPGERDPVAGVGEGHGDGAAHAAAGAGDDGGLRCAVHEHLLMQVVARAGE